MAYATPEQGPAEQPRIDWWLRVAALAVLATGIGIAVASCVFAYALREPVFVVGGGPVSGLVWLGLVFLEKSCRNSPAPPPAPETPARLRGLLALWRGDVSPGR
jgi:hypothetical protein